MGGVLGGGLLPLSVLALGTVFVVWHVLLLPFFFLCMYCIIVRLGSIDFLPTLSFLGLSKLAVSAWVLHEEQDFLR